MYGLKIPGQSTRHTFRLHRGGTGARGYRNEKVSPGLQPWETSLDGVGLVAVKPQTHWLRAQGPPLWSSQCKEALETLH